MRGLGDACRALGLPVTGGNVSLYNEAPTGAIAPTPEIGVVGLIDDVGRAVGPAFATERDVILLVGETTPGLTGSAYAALAGTAVEDDPPALDLAREAALQTFIREADRARARGDRPRTCPVAGSPSRSPRARCGATTAPRVRLAVANSPAVELFGESPSRLVVTTRPRFAPGDDAAGPPARPAGRGDRHRRRRSVRHRARGAGATGAAEERGSRVADALEVPIADLRHAWDHGLARALGWEG